MSIVKICMLVFDLEFYVPQEFRESSKTSLIMNPTRDENIILGGSFYVHNPFKFSNISRLDYSKIQDFWIWNQKAFNDCNINDYLLAEKQLLEKIYNYIDNYALKVQKKAEEYRLKKGWDSPAKKKIKYAGIGISRSDLPILYIRSNFHSIASSPDLFEIYLSHHPFDLANVTFGYVRKKSKYPKLDSIRSTEIFKHYNVDFEKDSSKSVWDLFEENQFDKIKHRTHNELKSTVEVLVKLQNKLKFN